MALAISARPALQPLPWDSEHFGWPVARIARPVLSPAPLRALLDQARRDGICLVYWAALPGHPPPQHLLAEYTGRVVTGQVTFQKDLTTSFEAFRATSRRWAIRPYTGAQAMRPLLDLGIAAGVYSRFRVDPRIPRERFTALYEIWVQRSIQRDLAQRVLVATSGRPAEDVLGMVTTLRAGETAEIGLLAVTAAARRHGIGTAFLQAAEAWARVQGAQQIQVVTQLANRPACALYQRAGYRPVDLRQMYHFWPGG